MRRVLLFLALLLGAPSCQADDVGSIYFDVRYAGIRIATTKITGSIDDTTYRLAVETEYNVIFYSGTVKSRVNGRRNGGQLLPHDYSQISGSDPKYRIDMTFDAGAAKVTLIEPPLEPDWNEGRVPLKPEHSQNVLDPLSALISASLHAGLDADNACRAALPVFTGLSRFDLVLSPRPADRTAAHAASGEEKSPSHPVIGCAVRFLPIAGHRPSNPTVKILKEPQAIFIDFDKEAVGPVRLPRRIEIRTPLGAAVLTRAEKQPS